MEDQIAVLSFRKFNLKYNLIMNGDVEERVEYTEKEVGVSYSAKLAVS
jgi:hypothetical protein